MDRLDPLMRMSVLGGKMDLRKDALIRIDPVGAPDEVGIPMTCPLLEAATALDVIREHDHSMGDRPTRIYILRNSTWLKLSSSALLTQYLISEDRTILNPKVFTSTAPVLPDQPLAPRKVIV